MITTGWIFTDLGGRRVPLNYGAALDGGSLKLLKTVIVRKPDVALIYPLSFYF